MIQLKRIKKQNPFEPEKPQKYYASAQHSGKSDIDSLATEVAARCSIRRADVYGVLVALMDIIPEDLLNGKVVSLGELGSFYLTVRSDGAQTAEKLTTGMVKGVKIQYRPTKMLKTKLKTIEVRFED